MKFATKPIRHHPPHHRHVAVMKNICRDSADMEDIGQDFEKKDCI